MHVRNPQGKCNQIITIRPSRPHPALPIAVRCTVARFRPVYWSLEFRMSFARRLPTFWLSGLLALLGVIAPNSASAAMGKNRKNLPQETGFLNRSITIRGITYRYEVYLPEGWKHEDRRLWPVILFLHGRGERGSEGMWQTQIGLPAQVRDHPDRWPFIIVMPQCPQDAYWTDPASLEMAIATLNREISEFNGDPDRTYLTGLSLGGYGAWELARLYPHRWAAVAIASGGIFWSYAPERWTRAYSLPAEYARAVGRTPFWLFHGTEDSVVNIRQSEIMYEALKTSGGRVRLWIYQGMHHDTWTRAYNEPELPRWLLEHHLPSAPNLRSGRANVREPEPPPYAERIVIPLHPPALRLTEAQIDNLTGEYLEPNGHTAMTIFWQNEKLYGRNRYGEIDELAAETPTELFYPQGSYLPRIIGEHAPDGRITAIVLRDDRNEERWEKRIAPPIH
jgi:predicted esterase